MRTVIYARFSSQLQNSRLIDDQVAVCRERADREGWSIVEVFTDYALSSAAGIGEMQRPALTSKVVEPVTQNVRTRRTRHLSGRRKTCRTCGSCHKPSGTRCRGAGRRSEG